MTKEEILLQIMELRKIYTDLYYDGEGKTNYKISGSLEFRATYKKATIEDTYQILVSVPKSFPTKLPAIKEMGGRIPPSFHTNPDETLCLEAPIKLYLTFNKNPTILHYVESCAIPFFYSFSYLIKYGELPFGERAHGGEGLLEMYKQFFQLNDDNAVIALIKILAENKYKGSNACPCLSGKKIHRCHGPLLKEIQYLQGSKYYSVEYIQILEYMREKDIRLDNSLFSETAYSKARKLLREN